MAQASRSDQHRHIRGAGSSAHEHNDAGLTDVSAPAPVQDLSDNGQWRQAESLEEAEESDTARNGDVEEYRRHSKLAPKPSRYMTEIYTVSYLICFAIMGTLARLGVQWLTYYPGAPVTISNLWANFSGSLAMGFLSEDQRLFRQEWGQATKAGLSHEKDDGQKESRLAHNKVKKTIPLFIGLTTGFCGSFTSFSTFMRDVFYAIGGILPTPDAVHSDPTLAQAAANGRLTGHSGGYNFEAVVAVILLTLGMSLFALKIGAQLALACERFTPTLSFPFTRRYIDPIFVVLGFGSWLGAVFMTIWPPDRPGGPTQISGQPEEWRGVVLFAITFAPVGCLLRYVASLKLNPIQPAFPLGTFAVNVFGTAVLGMSYDIQHSAIGVGTTIGGAYIGCQALQGIEDGFCGALTTVSTWVNEINSLRTRHAWFYAWASILVGLGLVVIIFGSVLWTVDFSNPVCVTGRSN